MKRLTPINLLLALCLVLLAATQANARVEIDITKGNVEPLPIAIMDFEGDQVAQDIVSVIDADLRSTGLFRPIEKAAFIETSLGANSTPRFGDWKQINAQALVNGAVKRMPNGKLESRIPVVGCVCR